jgi:lysophospholipase L1-like esterase
VAAVRTPAALLRGGRRPGTHTVVICAGDSITKGVFSANYVELLASRLGQRGYEFINAGVNGELAYNVVTRLDEIVACRPDVVTLLVGTNDVNATFSPTREASYRLGWHVPVKPTLEWYRQNVATILDRLAPETSARIAVLEIPMLGEDLSSEMNQRVDAYNAALRALAAERDLLCLPLHDRLRALLPADHRPPPYEGHRAPILRAAMEHYLLRRSWDAVSAEHGLRVLTDHLHLNDTGASVVADLIASFLESPPDAATRAAPSVSGRATGAVMVGAADQMPLVLPLMDAAASLAAAGGKGASLARMAAAGLPVPSGFHVTTAAYRRFVDANGLQESILTAVSAARSEEPATLDDAARQIAALFAAGAVPGDVAGAIGDAYATLGGEALSVAVRSSATAEDLPDLSFAGQQELSTTTASGGRWAVLPVAP